VLALGRYRRLATASRDPPAGSDRPPLLRALSAVRTHPKAECTQRDAVLGERIEKFSPRRKRSRERASTGSSSETNDVR
jgi:hypothetical protein